MTRTALASLLALTLSTATTASGPADFEFTTADGLTVRMIVVDGSGLVASNVFVGAGSTRETEETAGSSHFLEHLLFNGTSTMTQEELYAAADRIGAYNNATTRQEYTHYMMVAPKEELRAALRIQAAMLLDSTLPEDKFEKERGIVLEEMNKDADSPTAVRQRKLDALLEAGAPAFLRPVLGTPESIAALRREDVLGYYHRQYLPSNMKLLLMGDFDPESARTDIEELFASERSGKAQPAARAVWPASSSWAVDGSEDELSTVVVQLPAPAVEEADFVPVALMVDALGGGESNRLARTLENREDLEIQEAGASVHHLHGGSHIEIRVSGAVGMDTESIVEAILGELATLGRTGLDAAEWEQAKNRALSESIRQIEQLHYYALLQGDRIWHSAAGFEARYQEALTHSHELVAEAAARWFGEPVLKVAVLDPGAEDSTREFEPRESGYVAREEAPVAAGAPEESVAATMPPIVSQPQPADVLRLENGLTLIHSASPSTRMFAVHVLVRDRSAREPAQHPGMADLLHRCLPQGAGEYGREEFSGLLDAIGAELKLSDSSYIPYDDYYTMDPRFSFLRLDCVDVYWEEALRLTGLMLTAPRLDDEQIDREREKMMQRVRQDAGSTGARARAEFAAALYGPRTPRSRPIFGNPGSLDGVDGSQLRAFAREYLDPSQLIVSVVGNIDREAVLAKLRELWDFPADRGQETVSAAKPEPTAESLRIPIEMDGKQTNIRMGRVMEIDPADRWALEVAVIVASGRMQQDLRETRGWAYSLGIGLETQDDRASLVAHMGTRPDVAPEAEAAVESWLETGRLEVRADELAAAVNSNLGRGRMRRVTSIGRAFNLGFDYFTEGSVEVAAERSAALRAVTAEDVARVSERYFREAPLITVVVK